MRFLKQHEFIIYLRRQIMAELRRKITLEKKGEEAYVSVKQLMVSLKWTADVDLDLMAFYRTKDGQVGGVFSDNYPGGTLGSLNTFPFIELSGDEGVGATGGDNEEVLRITKLDHLAELFIVTLNYTDAVEKRQSTFSDYDGSVNVMNDKGETVEVLLNSTDRGQVAVICKIDNSSPMGAKLINMNNIMDLGDFLGTVPGANLLVG
ncbi:MAG: stress response protein [Candidatus Hodarchaeota archaeon]